MFGTIPDTWMRLHWRVELGTPPPAHPFRVYNVKEQTSLRKVLRQARRKLPGRSRILRPGLAAKERPYTPQFPACQILMLSFFSRLINGMRELKD